MEIYYYLSQRIIINLGLIFHFTCESLSRCVCVSACLCISDLIWRWFRFSREARWSLVFTLEWPPAGATKFEIISLGPSKAKRVQVQVFTKFIVYCINILTTKPDEILIRPIRSNLIECVVSNLVSSCLVLSCLDLTRLGLAWLV